MRPKSGSCDQPQTTRFPGCTKDGSQVDAGKTFLKLSMQKDALFKCNPHPPLYGLENGGPQFIERNDQHQCADRDNFLVDDVGVVTSNQVCNDVLQKCTS